MNEQNKNGDYVPVLRWKAAEVDAFYNLEKIVKQQITPMFELCPVMFIREKKVGDNFVKVKLPITVLYKMLIELKSVVGKTPFYMDLKNVDDRNTTYSNQSLWESILEYGKFIKLPIIPVTGFYGNGSKNQNLIGSIATEFGNGICIRLFQKDILRQSFHSDINRLLSMLNSTPSHVDLIIDFQFLNNQSISYTTIENKLPHIDKWRSITFLAGSFPENLGHLQANDTYMIPRFEWLKYQREIISNSPFLKRIPRFGDYTIQHSIYKEPPDFVNVSASIRYTHNEKWVIIRGEALGKEGGIGYDQYPAEAQLLVEKNEYCGANYSRGDEIIMEKSKNGSNTGTPETWIMIGINHHVTHTVYQLCPELLENKVKENTKLQKSEKVQQELWEASSGKMN